MNNEFNGQPDGYTDRNMDPKNINTDNSNSIGNGELSGNGMSNDDVGNSWVNNNSMSDDGAGDNRINNNSMNNDGANSKGINGDGVSNYGISNNSAGVEDGNGSRYPGYETLPPAAYSSGRDAADVQTGKSRKKRRVPGFVKLVAAAMAFGIIAGAAFQGYYAVTTLGSGKDNPGGMNPQATVTEATDKNSAVAETTSTGGVVADVSDVVAKAMPSIVAINATVTTTGYDFFGRSYDQEAQGSGSGIIIGQDSSTLYIATNNHVISGASDVQIVFADDSTATGTIKGADANSDLAVVTVDMNSLSKDTAEAIKMATLGDSEDVKAGEMAIAIGNALGYGQSVTVGYISAVNRKVDINGQSMTLLQTDAAINPGNSGGALLNAAGQVIGINSIKYASEEIEGMGYAIPISKAVPIINELMNREVVATGEQGFLGIDASTAQEVTQAYAERFNMPIGVYINDVIESSPAEAAGLKRGDIITGLDSSKVETIDDLVSALSFKKEGQKVNLVIQAKENGEYVEKTLCVTLGKKN